MALASLRGPVRVDYVAMFAMLPMAIWRTMEPFLSGSAPVKTNTLLSLCLMPIAWLILAITLVIRTRGELPGLEQPSDRPTPANIAVVKREMFWRGLFLACAALFNVSLSLLQH